MGKMATRVARAMCKATGCDPDALVEAGATLQKTGRGFAAIPDGKSHRQWEFWISETYEALRAMREPTEAMIRAGEGCDDYTTSFVQGAGCEDHWRAMIDAALK